MKKLNGSLKNMARVLDFRTNKEDREHIKEMARRYFDKNPRRVKSFVRDLVFLTRTVKPRYEHLKKKPEPEKLPEDTQEEKNLEEIIQNPALLAKMIIIREEYPDDFREIQNDPSVITKLEENPSADLKNDE